MNIITKTIAASAVMMTLFATNTSAADNSAVDFAKVGGWTVRADITVDTCFMFAVTTRNKTVVRLQLAKNGGVALMLMNPRWTSITGGSKHDMTLTFDQDEPYSGTATGLLWAKKYPTVILPADFDFMVDFAEKSSIKITVNGKTVLNTRLNKTKLAVQSMMRCQAQLTASIKKNDPFNGSGSSTTNADPFKSSGNPKKRLPKTLTEKGA